MKPPSFQRDDTVMQSLPSFESKWGPVMSIGETPVPKVVTDSMDVTKRRKELEEAGSVDLLSEKRSRKSIRFCLLAFILLVAGVTTFLLTTTSDSQDEELIGPTQQPTTIRELIAELCAVVDSDSRSVFFCEDTSVSWQCNVESGVLSEFFGLCPLEGGSCDCEPDKFAEVSCPIVSQCQDINLT